MYYLSRRAFLKIMTALSTLPLMSQCVDFVEPLRIGSHVWSGYELMFLARRENWLLPSSVNLISTLSATESIQALLTDKIHGAALTLDEVLRTRAQGVALTCVLVFDVSAGADMVLTKTPLNSLADLAGKRIGVETSAVGNVMLYKLLQMANLDKSAVIPVAVNFDQHLAAWQQENLDALITFEPVASQLLNQGAYKLFDSRKIPDTIFDVLAIKTDLLSHQAEHIRHLVATHFHARHYFYHNPQDAAYKMATRMNLNASDVLNSFRGLNLPNEQTNEKYLTVPESPLLLAAQNLSKLMVENGSISQPDSLENLLCVDFLPRNP